MRTAALAALILSVPLAASRAEDKADAFPAFKVQDLDTGMKVGWATLIEDVNGDGKKDIIVVAPTRVVWCENPTWKVHTMIDGTTKPNNMTITAVDLEGNGKRNFALGGGWKPFDTKGPASVVWLRRGKEATDPWEPSPIADEPMTHRVRFADVLGEGKPQLIVAPLMGRGSTLEKNWLDGQPIRVTLHRIPKDPVKDRWVPEVIDESMHVIHAVTPVERKDGKGMDLLIGSYEGVHLLARDGGGKWTKRQLCAGNQENPNGHRGSSEVKPGKLKDGRKFLATIEPWHGNQVVVYTDPANKDGLWVRHVIDDQLKWGHAVVCADLDGDGSDELLIGVQHDLEDKPGKRRGVRLYKATDGSGEKWVRSVLDDGGVAVEDLAVADLTGSGKLDIVAVGLQSGSVRIWWNQGTKK